MQRFLLAIDLTGALATKADSHEFDPYSLACWRSFLRREDDRRELTRKLAALGWKMVPVPGLGEADRGIDPLNGVHDRMRYLKPAYAGMYAAVDRAAQDVFQRVFGPDVQILPILSSESQRRGGSVDCSAAIYPRI